MGPGAFGVPGLLLGETSGMLRMISAAKTLRLAAAARSMLDQQFFESTLPLWHVERGPRSDPGHARIDFLWSGGVMATPSFCHAWMLGQHCIQPSHGLFHDDALEYRPQSHELSNRNRAASG